MKTLLISRSSVKVGDRFGRLVIIGSPFKTRSCQSKCTTHVVVQCDCGKRDVVLSWNLTKGDSSSCGCAHRKKVSTQNRVFIEYPEICAIRKSAIARCGNTNNPQWANYGGRGITVCDDWKTSASAFVEWCLNNGYREGLQIDRRDNNAGYTPENCRFVTLKTNCNNTRRTKMVTAFSETKPQTEWADDVRCVVSYRCLVKRLKIGWNPEKAITQASHRRGRIPEKPRLISSTIY